MTNSVNWSDTAKVALTNLADLGTNTVAGLMNTAKDKLQGSPTNNVAPIYPAPAQNENLFLWLAAGAMLFLVLKKKR